MPNTLDPPRPAVLSELPASCHVLDAAVDRRRQYLGAMTYAEFLEEINQQRDLWLSVTRRVTLAPEVLRRVRTLHGAWHLLVLAEDWCADGLNTVPFVARLAQLTLNLDCRILRRDEHPGLMDEHLSAAARAIPVVMILDDEFREHGWWASRPQELEAWLQDRGNTLPPQERVLEKRRWYARDNGRAAVDEIVTLLERLDTECLAGVRG